MTAALRLVLPEDFSSEPEQPPRGPRLKRLVDLYVAGKPSLSSGAAGQYYNAVNLARRFLLTVTSVPLADGKVITRKRSRTTCEELFTLDAFCLFARWLSIGRAAPTINGRLDVLWMLWDFAHCEGHYELQIPPAKKKPRWKEPKRDPVAFTLPEIDRLIAACVLAPSMKKCPWWTADFWIALVSTFLATCERFEALLMCPRSALQGNVLTVPAELTKDGKEEPVVLQQEIADKLRALPQIDDSPLFFPYPFELRTLRERFDRDILRLAKLPNSRHHKFHCLRRSAVTQIYIVHGLEAARQSARHFGQGLTLTKYVSQKVVRQQTGTPSFSVPSPKPPKKPDPQKRLFHLPPEEVTDQPV